MNNNSDNNNELFKIFDDSSNGDNLDDDNFTNYAGSEFNNSVSTNINDNTNINTITNLSTESIYQDNSSESKPINLVDLVDSSDNVDNNSMFMMPEENTSIDNNSAFNNSYSNDDLDDSPSFKSRNRLNINFGRIFLILLFIGICVGIFLFARNVISSNKKSKDSLKVGDKVTVTEKIVSQGGKIVSSDTSVIEISDKGTLLIKGKGVAIVTLIKGNVEGNNISDKKSDKFKDSEYYYTTLSQIEKDILLIFEDLKENESKSISIYIN